MRFSAYLVEDILFSFQGFFINFNQRGLPCALKESWSVNGKTASFVVFPITDLEDTFVRNFTRGTCSTDMTLYGSSHSSSHVVIICLLLRVGTILLRRADISTL